MIQDKKNHFRLIQCFLLVGAIGIFHFTPLHAQKIKPKQVLKEMEAVADWQIEHFRDTFSIDGKKPHHIADWTNGALYVGMVKWAALAQDDRYYEWLKSVGNEQDWQLHWRKYHADDHAIGQMYIELFRKYSDSTMILPTIQGMDYIIDHPSEEPITLDNYQHLERWTWCDALFMAPPVLAKLANITGDERYTDFMMREYQATTDHLFDPTEKLYYRDNSYIGKLDHGHKIFWSRGNGWVFGGLTLIMDEYPVGSEEYNYFLDIYKQMAAKLITIQTPEGHWAMSLLAQDLYPTPEASGTAFFTFGLAWGINHGVLDRATYEPTVRKAWQALTSYITKDGMLGYVQPIGAAPGSAWPDKTEVYGTGAFLAAGSEVYQLYKK
ncbi:glycoside hydrolase family 88 protein [Reichenbachiella agarivorans]|uniref:Glycoside hydrolase family 88 protein n=1 Tax=Reichenbachiella agarivorans TaxID=2979464 RepID=A0ABY6CQG4_9BACT|nr:glycoside hydrolase family 88 protein [Reichenbachiella agarivorans]UXP32039.1 glycoside hydrolase family 88 protein [Reichenbachiella agarivorans]